MFPSGQVRILRRYDNEGAFMVLFDGWVFRSRRGFERRLTRRGILVGRARSACLSQILCCSWDDIVLQPWIPALHYVQSKSTLIPTLHLIQRLLEFRCESLSIRDDRNKPTCTSRSVVILPGFRLFADAGQRAHLIQMSDFEWVAQIDLNISLAVKAHASCACMKLSDVGCNFSCSLTAPDVDQKSNVQYLQRSPTPREDLLFGHRGNRSFRFDPFDQELESTLLSLFGECCARRSYKDCAGVRLSKDRMELPYMSIRLRSSSNACLLVSCWLPCGK